MKQKSDKRILGVTYITFVSEQDDNGELLDTVVKIEDEIICVIAGDTIDEFYEQLQGLTEKYRI